MIKLFNFNEIRKLAAKAAEKRQVLGCLRIKDGIGVFTDGFVAVEIEGYNPDTHSVINLNTYEEVPVEDYPDTDKLLRVPFHKPEFRPMIYKGQVVYGVEITLFNETEVINYYDTASLDQAKKLIADRKVSNKITIDDVELNKTNALARIKVGENSYIYQTLKRYKED